MVHNMILYPGFPFYLKGQGVIRNCFCLLYVMCYLVGHGILA